LKTPLHKLNPYIFPGFDTKFLLINPYPANVEDKVSS